ncbi:MAG: RNA polymerase sigma factor [Anaerolineae bacterium]|nr:RNA polymerase sigma factor [Anaerolineae bacterium]
MNPKPPFESLVTNHSREILGYLWRILGDSGDAEDCLQDTFLRSFKAYKRLDGDANYRAWLYKIATNTAYTHLKKRNAVAMRTSDLSSDVTLDSPTISPDDENRFPLEAVKSAIDNLPNKQRSALMLRKYQELSYAEIGLALNCSEESARANVYQALKKLREEFRDTPKDT